MIIYPRKQNSTAASCQISCKRKKIPWKHLSSPLTSLHGLLRAVLSLKINVLVFYLGLTYPLNITREIFERNQVGISWKRWEAARSVRERGGSRSAPDGASKYQWERGDNKFLKD